MSSARAVARSREGGAIVVGTDLSPSSAEALDRATAIAKSARAALHVVHATSRLPRALVKTLLGGVDEHAERTALEQAVARARAARVTATPHLKVAAPAEALRAAAREVSAALVVVGARGRALDSIVGSTAERVAALLRRPVLLVRRSAQRDYASVIVAADANVDLRAADEAASLVAPGAKRTVVHAYEGLFETPLRLHGAGEANIQVYRRGIRREARDMMSERMEEAGLDPADLVLRHGDPRHVLAREEGRHRDVLFVIERGRSEVAHALLGSVTRSIIANGTSDVLIV